MSEEHNLDTMLSDSKAILDQHLHNYIKTGGKIGHLWDTRPWGGPGINTAMVLRVIGRKSGNPLLVTLVYAPWGDEFVVIGSKAGAEGDPAWYLNLVAKPEMEFQVGGKCWHGTWRQVEGEERDDVWAYMVGVYPPYANYQAHTPRRLPVILLKPGVERPLFELPAPKA